MINCTSLENIKPTLSKELAKHSRSENNHLETYTDKVFAILTKSIEGKHLFSETIETISSLVAVEATTSLSKLDLAAVTNQDPQASRKCPRNPNDKTTYDAIKKAVKVTLSELKQHQTTISLSAYFTMGKSITVVVPNRITTPEEGN